jgi:hypothetical protein
MKSGQVTIFVIVGVVAIVGIIAALFFVGKVGVTIENLDNPRLMIKSCVEDLVEESLEKTMANGGLAMTDLGILHDGKNWTYLCYSGNYYSTCYNMHPMLEYQVEQQIVKDTEEGVQECFNSMREEYEDIGYDVKGEATDYIVDLLPNYVDIKLKKDIVLSYDGSSSTYSNFGFEVKSNIYDLVETARLIVNDESQYCNFEYNGFMLLYPDFNIRRISYKESRLYRVMSRESGEEFKFAVRSCAFPPGI